MQRLVSNQFVSQEPTPPFAGSSLYLSTGVADNPVIAVELIANIVASCCFLLVFLFSCMLIVEH